jgi:asparagine synthase (glutamine-hydrolysing)
VTVALSGDGGDECFGGYRRYRFDLVENRVRSFVPRAMRAAIFGSLGRIWPKADFLPRPLRFKTLLENLARDPVEAYFRSVSRVRPEEAVAMLDPDLRAQIAGYRTVDRYYAIDKERKTSDPLARIRSLDFETWLPDDILVKVDRASMANSLEVRSPLLDARLVAFASGLPPEYLIAGGSGKRVLKDAARRLLPSEVIDRKKHGFDLPVKRWLAGPLAEEIDSLSRPASSLAGRFDLARVASVTAEHRRGLRDRTAELWMLLMFSRFARRYADGRAP